MFLMDVGIVWLTFFYFYFNLLAIIELNFIL